jgi:hypothetical protein
MDTRWTEQGTRAVVSLPLPFVARLFGLPFLAVGGYLGSILVGGILHPSEMTVAGWTLLPLVTLAFLAPGLALVLMRKRVVIDAGARVALDETNFLIYTKRTSTHLPADAHVLLRVERGSGGTNSRNPLYWIHVHLVTDTAEVLLAMFADREKADARAFAGRVATFLRVDVVDHIVEHGEVNAAGVVVERPGDDDVA